MVVNHTSIVGIEQTHLLDTLLKLDIKIVKVFAPEHGFRGNTDAGETVKDGKDLRTGIPIISLYGNNKKPTAGQLKDIDIILFDIQDVGARFLYLHQYNVLCHGGLCRKQKGNARTGSA